MTVVDYIKEIHSISKGNNIKPVGMVHSNNNEDSNNNNSSNSNGQSNGNSNSNSNSNGNSNSNQSNGNSNSNGNYNSNNNNNNNDTNDGNSLSNSSNSSTSTSNTNSTSGNNSGNVIKVTTANTLADCIRLVTTHKIHRIYIIDDHFKPIGVISLSDILRELIEVKQ